MFCVDKEKDAKEDLQYDKMKTYQVRSNFEDEKGRPNYAKRSYE